jgi:hypothetical protein
LASINNHVIPVAGPQDLLWCSPIRFHEENKGVNPMTAGDIISINLIKCSKDIIGGHMQAFTSKCNVVSVGPEQGNHSTQASLRGTSTCRQWQNFPDMIPCISNQFGNRINWVEFVEIA